MGVRSAVRSFAVSIFAVATIVLFGATAPAAALANNMRAPGAAGVKWYVCQGYNTGTHSGKFDIDLTVVASEVGSTGCMPGANGSWGKPVYSPAAGRVYWEDAVTGAICVNMSSGGSMMFAHLEGWPKPGTTLSAGTPIGKVAAAGQRRNNNVAHLHVSAWSTSNCQGTRVPFDAAHNARFACAPDMKSTGKVNEWSKAVVYNCGTGRLGGVNMQKACDLQYPGAGRIAKVLRSNDAYSWSCVSSSGNQASIDVNRQCRYLYSQDAVARVGSTSDPYSWYCAR